jgi:hypothetical protein
VNQIVQAMADQLRQVIPLNDHDRVFSRAHRHDESSSADNIASDMATEGRLYKHLVPLCYSKTFDSLNVRTSSCFMMQM